jgi:riboflavin synthase
LFSGIIEELGTVASLDRQPDGGGRLRIQGPKLIPACGVGDSVAINGVCLTVAFMEGDLALFDLSEETLRVTDLGRLEAGDRVNLELSLKVGDRLGGHFVSGHVDAVGKIVERIDNPDSSVFTISVDERFFKMMIDRGSIGVDGISLTLTKVAHGAFEVVIIPHTAKMTTLGVKRAGDDVNLELDMIGKYVAKLVGNQLSGVDQSAV